jgi:tRNA-binding protein
MSTFNEINWEDFTKVEIRAGKIIKAELFREARKPAYKLLIDFGPEIGTLKSSVQITDLYSLEDLEGKMVSAVVNFPPKQIGPLMSQCLVCGFYRDSGEVVLCVPDKDIQPGSKLS